MGHKQFLRECREDPGRAAWMRAMMDRQKLVTVTDSAHVVQFGTRAGTWPGGRFRGFDIPAGDYEFDVAFMYRFQDERIAERWAIRDDLDDPAARRAPEPGLNSERPQSPRTRSR